MSQKFVWLQQEALLFRWVLADAYRFHNDTVKLLQFVSASQPLNALAYVFDGLHYGVSDFAYVAWAMVSWNVVNQS